MKLVGGSVRGLIGKDEGSSEGRVEDVEAENASASDS